MARLALILGGLVALAASPVLAETIRTPIGPRLEGCRMQPGPAEAMVCEGVGGWRIVVGYPAFGATLVLSRGDLPGAGGSPSFSLDSVGDRSLPAIWEVKISGSRRIAEAVIIPVAVMHPDDRERMIGIGRPIANARRADLFLAYRLDGPVPCLAAIIDRSVTPAAIALARTAVLEPTTCPAAPRIVGRQSDTLASVLAARR
jgi:hypothetical protein